MTNLFRRHDAASLLTHGEAREMLYARKRRKSDVQAHDVVEDGMH